MYGKRKCYNCVFFWMGILLTTTRNSESSQASVSCFICKSYSGNSSQGPEEMCHKYLCEILSPSLLLQYEFRWEEIVTWRTLWGTRKNSHSGVQGSSWHRTTGHLSLRTVCLRNHNNKISVAIILITLSWLSSALFTV